MIVKNLVCDYFVIGAGAAPLAFIDTLLTELPNSKIILIDKKQSPGGHWVNAYDFVRLHQPSMVYGVASKQLEGNWLKLLFSKFTFPWTHRANKMEILTYFDNFVKAKIGSDQLEFYPQSVYNFNVSSIDEDGLYTFSSVDGSTSYKVKVNEKLIDGTPGECIIPSELPLQFPVDDGVQVMTPNQIHDAAQKDDSRGYREKKYIVLGAGKTGMDSIIYLQRTMKVNPDNIAWVISNDVWMMRGGTPWHWPRYIAKYDGDVSKAAQALEEEGIFTRLDKDILPTKFRFPVIRKDEYKFLKRVKKVIRRGRATAIRRNNSKVEIEFADHQPWESFAPADDCVFVHAASPGPFNGINNPTIFDSDKKMTLRFMFPPPISISYSTLAKLEAARKKGTLDLEFGRRALHLLERTPEGTVKENDKKFTENDVLNSIIRSFPIQNLTMYRPIFNLAAFFALLDKDPTVGFKWMKGNRLSFLSIPYFKCQAYEDLEMIRSKGKTLQLTDNDIILLDLLSDKIQPLEGM